MIYIMIHRMDPYGECALYIKRGYIEYIS